MEFYLILVADVCGFVDVLISFWSQRSKGKVTAEKQDEYNIFVNI